MAGDSLMFGVTVDQIDRLDRLVRTISAAGDVIAVGGTAHLAPGSLPALGDTIFSSAGAVREILDQIEEQKIAGHPGPGDGAPESSDGD